MQIFANMNSRERACGGMRSDLWRKCKADVALANSFDLAALDQNSCARGDEVWQECRESEAEAEALKRDEDVSDERLSRLAIFTDHLQLDRYLRVFELVPSLVNVVRLDGLFQRVAQVGGLTFSNCDVVGHVD